MSLWLDRYRPTSLENLDYHKEQAAKLKNLVKKGDFPHLLLYGPQGAGKKTRVLCLLRELYGNGVEKLRMEPMTFITPSGKKLDISTLSSNYHIEVNPSDVGIYDRTVIQDLIKNVAQTHQLDSTGQREFKVIVITGVDLLTRDAQHALRRTMEKYISTCRLMLMANSTSRVIPAIQSRCLGIRIPAPTEEEVAQVLRKIAKKEKITVPEEIISAIVTKTDCNLRRAILTLQAARVQQYPFQPNQQIPEPDWRISIRGTATLILEEQSPKRLYEIRERLYEAYTHGVPMDLIFQLLLEELLKNCDMELKKEVIHWAAFYEHRMHQGSKHMFHLEAFVAKFMSIYKAFIESSLADEF